MKRLLLAVLLIALPATLYAADVNLAWDASTSPEVAGYALFDRNFEKSYDYANPSWISEDPAALTGSVAVPDDRLSAFVARAWGWGPYDLDGNRTRVYSADSNEVVYTPPSPVINPPRNIVVRILVAIADFFGRFFG